jgi:hypothetical protein
VLAAVAAVLAAVELVLVDETAVVAMVCAL